MGFHAHVGGKRKQGGREACKTLPVNYRRAEINTEVSFGKKACHITLIIIVNYYNNTFLTLQATKKANAQSKQKISTQMATKV